MLSNLFRSPVALAPIALTVVLAAGVMSSASAQSTASQSSPELKARCNQLISYSIATAPAVARTPTASAIIRASVHASTATTAIPPKPSRPWKGC